MKDQKIDRLSREMDRKMISTSLIARALNPYLIKEIYSIQMKYGGTLSVLTKKPEKIIKGIL